MAGAWVWELVDTRTASRSRRLLDLFGVRWDDLAHPLQWFRLFTSPYVQPDTEFGAALLIGLALCVCAELRLGSRRTAAMFVGTDLISTLTVFVALRLLEAGGSHWAAMIHHRDGGASSGTIGIVVALLASLPDRRIRLVGGALLVVTLLRALPGSSELADRQHLAALVIAMVAVRLTGRHRKSLPAWQRCIRTKTRDTEPVA